MCCRCAGCAGQALVLLIVLRLVQKLDQLQMLFKTMLYDAVLVPDARARVLTAAAPARPLPASAGRVLARTAARQVVDVAFFLLLVVISFSIMATQLFGLSRYLYSYSSDEHINFRSACWRWRVAGLRAPDRGGVRVPALGVCVGGRPS